MIKAARKFEKEQHAVYTNLPKVSYYLLSVDASPYEIHPLTKK